MPYDLQGNFTRLHKWEEDRKNNIEIMSDRHDEEDDNFSDAFNQCFLRDGRVVMSGNLNVGNYQIKNVAQATAENDAVTLSQANEIKDNAVQECKDIISSMYSIGDIKASLQQANHGDWLLCNGQEVSRTEYEDLFNLIGISFGSGDNINTFNVPDYRGKFLRGLGGDSETNMYTTQAEGLPNITGNIQFRGIHSEKKGDDAFANSSFSATDTWGSDGSGFSLALNFNASNSNAIYGASAHVTPINQAVNWFIKAKGE